MNQNLLQWLANGDRGLSSNAMVHHLTGIKTEKDFHRKDYPRDPSDLGRCRKLLEQVPELRDDLPRMATCSEQWARIVKHWDELCALMDEEAPRWRDFQGNAPKTYALMQLLTRATRATA